MLREFVKDLNSLYRNEAALHEKDFEHAGFDWIDFRDSDATVVSFLRKGGNECFLVFVFNFTPVPRKSYRVGVPQRAFYREIMNSDSAGYGGSGVVTIDTIESQDMPWHGRDFSISLDLPPLGMIALKPDTRQEV